MQVVFASNNAGKTREVAAALAGLDIELVPQSQFQVVEAEETGLTFVENALLKARNACRQTGLPAIADDSGVEVDALNGAPGVYSARYAGPGADDAANNARLLRELADVPDSQRTARYQCVMVYLRHADDPTPIICQAAWEGLFCVSRAARAASATTHCSGCRSRARPRQNWIWLPRTSSATAARRCANCSPRSAGTSPDQHGPCRRALPVSPTICRAATAEPVHSLALVRA